MGTINLYVVVLFFGVVVVWNNAFAENRIYDHRHKFEVSMPCEAVESKIPYNDLIFHLRNCYDSEGNSTTFVHTHSRVDGPPIRYRSGDINKAIEYEIIGSLSLLGGQLSDIQFRPFNNIRGLAGIHYHATGLNGGFIAEGVGFFKNGVHYRIGTLYSISTKSAAERNLVTMLETFEVH